MKASSNSDIRLALTGFMGVGKSSVARHLAHLLHIRRLDLDIFIEQTHRRRIAEIIDYEGLDAYRKIETACLSKAFVMADVRLLSLGGGTWTIEDNRELLRAHGFTAVWLESTFEHCWLNITYSRKDRPLARDKTLAKKLFEARQSLYALADWHVVVRPGQTSYDVAKEIAEQVEN